MLISRADMLLVRTARLFAPSFWYLAHLETTLLAKHLSAVRIHRPVFICGLARSGSTLLLELFSQLPGVATQRYRDFPFVAVPWFWNKFLDGIARKNANALERPHRDGILITAESPEAMDEPLLAVVRRGLAAVANRAFSEHSTHRFDDFYRQYLQKVLLVRGGQRLVSKNNYHVARIACLARHFDAHFVIPVRHPVEHVGSLLHQHALFCEYAKTDRRVPEYLAAAGHFEFGPQRRAFCPERSEQEHIQSLWQQGRDVEGYAVQWAAVYNHVCQLLESDQLRERVHLCATRIFCASLTFAGINCANRQASWTRPSMSR